MGNLLSTDIQVLETWEAVRKRPEMYLGSLDDPKLPNRLLLEALCMTRWEARKGGKVIQVTLEMAGNVLTISDDGPGWEVDLLPDGMRKAEAFLQRLHACRHMRDPEPEEGLCNTGIVTLVAFSKDFWFMTYRDGHHWEQRFARGKPVTKFEDCGPTSLHGTAMGFILDSDALPNVKIDPTVLEEVATELRKDGLEVRLRAWK